MDPVAFHTRRLQPYLLDLDPRIKAPSSTEVKKCLKCLADTIVFFVNNQQHKNGISVIIRLAYLKLQLSQYVEERDS